MSETTSGDHCHANRVAVITGGARGQGRSHALRLAQEGFDVVICDIADQRLESVRYPLATPSDLDETARAVEDHGRRCVAVVADVRSTEDMDEVASIAMTEFGRIDVLLANAGVMTVEENVWEISDAQWDETLGVNLTGAFKACRSVIPHMIAGDRGGAIVITSSIAGVRSYPSLTDYTAAKHGVVGLMRNLAQELGKHRIRVNTIHPTGVMTPMVINDFFDQWIQDNPQFREWTNKNVLPAPMLKTSDVSDAVSWLVSDQAKWVTGTAVPIDAGFLVK